MFDREAFLTHVQKQFISYICTPRQMLSGIIGCQDFSIWERRVTHTKCWHKNVKEVDHL
jgi:hypothetical protein